MLELVIFIESKLHGFLEISKPKYKFEGGTGFI